MSDITMCSGEGCKKKLTCFRFMATADNYQSYFAEVPLDANGQCSHYWDCSASTLCKPAQKKSVAIRSPKKVK